jgi:serine/threonine-protein kinase
MAGYVGTVVLNYRLVRKLGEGGFGAVFLAEHTELGRKVACKILHREFADQEEVVERFFREARSVCAIGHRAIVEIENFGRLPDGEPFYLMEYLAGESLSLRVKRRPLRVDEAVAVFEPVASALAAAHAKQIIHRDLKPENIMVREEHGAIVEVKLLDFGIAKLAHHADAVRSRSNVPLGTPAYMSPEQARDAKHVDERSDVYSFAATMYAALAGRPPFVADSIPGVILKVQLEPPPPLTGYAPHVPEALARVLARCMDKESGTRPPSMRAAWAAIQAASGVAAGAAPRERDPGLAVEPAVTEPPDRVHAADAMATTLGSAAGQRTDAGSGRRWMVWSAALVAVAVAAVALFVLELGGSGARSSAGSAAGSQVVARAVTVDAAETSSGTAVDPATDAAVDPAADATVAGVPAAPLDAPDVDPATRPVQPPKPHGRTHPRPSADPARPDPPRPDASTEPARPAAPALDCSVDSFARIYNASSPADADVTAALARLKKCQLQLTPDKFRQIQRQLVSKL